jgi:hypothetical protein
MQMVNNDEEKWTLEITSTEECIKPLFHNALKQAAEAYFRSLAP